MDTLRRNLPSLSGLVAFEAAARRLSFTRAGEELNVTQAAISRHVCALEADLGVSLFHRAHRRVRLTPDGERLAQAVTLGLQHIARTVGDLRRVRHAGQLTIAASVAFSSLWLMPRLARFHAAHPDVRLRLVAVDRFDDPAAVGVDLTVRYGDGRWPGMVATRLFADEIFPVCSPDYVARHGPFETIEDLLGESILRMDDLDPTWIDWPAWLDAMGVSTPSGQPGLRFNNYTLEVQAAVNGQGIALGWQRLVADLLESGALVRPVEALLPSSDAHYVILPAGGEPSLDAMALHDWLVAEASRL